MDEITVRTIIRDELAKYANDNQYDISPIPVHTHNGVDSQRIDSKDIIDSSRPYTADLTYTSSQTVVISPGFTPRKIIMYAYAVNTTLSPNVICISNGTGDYISAKTGICNSMQLSQDASKNITYGVADFIDRIVDVAGFSSTVNIKIASWNPSNITLAVTCAANWTIGVAVSITD